MFEQSAERAEAETKYLVAANWHLQINYLARVRACTAPRAQRNLNAVLPPPGGSCCPPPRPRCRPPFRRTFLISFSHTSPVAARGTDFQWEKLSWRVLVADSCRALRCLAQLPSPAPMGTARRRSELQSQVFGSHGRDPNTVTPLGDLGGVTCAPRPRFPHL